MLYSPDLGVSWFMRSLSSTTTAGDVFYYVKDKFILGMKTAIAGSVSPRIITDLSTADYVGTLAPVYNDGVGTNPGSCQGYLKIKNA